MLMKILFLLAETAFLTLLYGTGVWLFSRSARLMQYKIHINWLILWPSLYIALAGASLTLFFGFNSDSIILYILGAYTLLFGCLAWLTLYFYIRPGYVQGRKSNEIK